MKLFGLLAGLTLSAALQVLAAPTEVSVQDFEKPTVPISVWVVNIPNENATVKLSDAQAQSKQALQLHYKFTGEKGGEYLGVPVATKVLAPIHRLKWMMYGDGSNCNLGIYLIDIKGETHKYRDPAHLKVDFKGWKEINIDLDAPHEIWGGDKNSKIDYPITSFTFEIGNSQQAPLESDLYFDNLSAEAEKSAVETLGGQVGVNSPAYGADVKGDTKITISALQFEKVTASSWQAGGEFGTNANIANVALDKTGAGSFVFPAEKFPHGPITVTLTGTTGDYTDHCYLQLYNQGGVSWNENLPVIPPAAQGMKLVFADDFKGPLSIGGDSKATYYAHKPPNGSQDFSTLTFSDYEGERNPFSQVDSYLRIRADAKKNSAGLLSSIHNDATGITAKLPCYFECRFIGPNAIGTWPAFWLLSDYMTATKNGKKDSEIPVDELDIIEAYGGEGPGSPNAYDTYMVTPHAWNQGEAGKAAETVAFKAMNNPIEMKKFGIPSTWFEALHTYGCKITETDTIYYCDNIEVGRHKTLDTSKQYPFFFLINLATGGGWPVDLSRYDGRADMYVDWVRVYQGQ